MVFCVPFKRPAILGARFRSLFTFNFVTVGDIMKKIFLYAYDKINFGDDLFIRTIANRYPNVKFYLWSKKYNKKTFWNIKNLKVVAQDSKKLDLLVQIHPSLFSRYKSHLERKCDAVVYIGGSIFIEYENWKQILTWWEWEATNRNFYVLGANFGPYKTDAYREKFAEIFSDVTDICFRDKYSLKLFSDVKSVRYAPDILLGYEFSSIVPKKQVFISVIDCTVRNSVMDRISDKEELYLDLLTCYIKEYSKNGYDIILSSFCKAENDEINVEKLLNIVKKHKITTNISVKNYNGSNFDKILLSINESEVIIASRFHATILGFAAKRAVIPVVYSDKTINVLNDMGFKGKYFDIRKMNPSDIYDVYIPDNKDQSLENIDSLCSRSEKHFEKLDQLLR